MGLLWCTQAVLAEGGRKAGGNGQGAYSFHTAERKPTGLYIGRNCFLLFKGVLGGGGTGLLVELWGKRQSLAKRTPRQQPVTCDLDVAQYAIQTDACSSWPAGPCHLQVSCMPSSAPVACCPSSIDLLHVLVCGVVWRRRLLPHYLSATSLKQRLPPAATSMAAAAASSGGAVPSVDGLSVVSVHSNESVPLRSLWSERTTVVVFLRHWM